MAWWLSRQLDSLVGIWNPARAFARKQARFAYEVLDGSRLRKDRKKYKSTGDAVLTEAVQDDLRETSRDLSRNNSIVSGMLQDEANDIVGAAGPAIEVEVPGEWGKKAAVLWRQTMIEEACDHMGVHAWPTYVSTYYKSYRRDGDCLTILTDEGLQMIEGEQCGTPLGKVTNKLRIVNGVAYNEKGRRIGFYIGKPNRWGIIDSTSWKAYRAEHVHHMFNPERISSSRGEPALTPALKWLDMLDGYLDAEIVAARVNACFTMFISKKNPYGEIVPPIYNRPGAASGIDDGTGYRQEALEPGQILYGEPDETATGIGQSRPGQQFEMFIKTLMSLAGRPLSMPLMLITLDFSGATFMNARIALQQVQKLWMAEQERVLKPFVWRVWRWWVNRQIRLGLLPDHPDKYNITVFCNRWPYVDPYREAQAEKISLENRTENRHEICAAKGKRFEDVEKLRNEEEEAIAKSVDQKTPPTQPKQEAA